MWFNRTLVASNLFEWKSLVKLYYHVSECLTIRLGMWRSIEALMSHGESWSLMMMMRKRRRRRRRTGITTYFKTALCDVVYIKVMMAGIQNICHLHIFNSWKCFILQFRNNLSQKSPQKISEYIQSHPDMYNFVYVFTLCLLQPPLGTEEEVHGAPQGQISRGSTGK